MPALAAHDWNGPDYDPDAWGEEGFDLDPPDPETCKRATWTAGRAVVLDDGRLWHLPVVTMGMIYRNRILLLSVRGYFEACYNLPPDWAPGDPPPPGDLTLGHLVMAGRELIRANYRVGMFEPGLFMFFGQPERSADFLVATAEALAEIAEAWATLRALLMVTPIVHDDRPGAGSTAQPCPL